MAGRPYIIVEVGRFADGAGTPCFQLYERVTDWTIESYQLITTIQNDPVPMSKARDRLEQLERTTGVDPVPIGCSDRMVFLLEKADELGLTFSNGNRHDLLAGLQELPEKVAFAVLATIAEEGNAADRESLANFLREVA